jgi:hypothetical protein
MKDSLGFFYSGLRRNYIFWELFAHFEKAFIIIVNIILMRHDALFRVIYYFYDILFRQYVVL